MLPVYHRRFALTFFFDFLLYLSLIFENFVLLNKITGIQTMNIDKEENEWHVVTVSALSLTLARL